MTAFRHVLFKALGMVMIVLLVFGMVGELTLYTEAADRNQADSNLSQLHSDNTKMQSYQDYINSHSDARKPIDEIKIHLEKAEIKNNGTVVNDKGRFSVELKDNAVLQGVATVNTAGLYLIELSYRYLSAKNVDNCRFKVTVNGELPFEEAQDIELARLWRDEENIKIDSNGNDMVPKLVNADYDAKYTVSDVKSLYRMVYFYFKKGDNKLALAFEDADVRISALTLYNRKTVSYAEYQQNKPDAEQNTFFETLQAEKSLYKNSSILVASSDRSGPQTVPSDAIKRKLNVISSTKWKQPGDKITWEVNIQKDGYYTVGLRWRQNTMQGLFVSRRLLVDDQLLFQELDELRFTYGDDWKYTIIGKKDEPYQIFLPAGRHTLSLEAVCGSMAEVITQLKDAIYKLNTLYRRIIMITGVVPDTYRDYNLATTIPNLNEDFSNAEKLLVSVAEMIEQQARQKGGQTSIIWQLVYQLRSFISDDATVPERLDQFKSNISAVASLMLSLQQQPLDLDYITVQGTGSKQQPKGLDIGFFGQLFYHLKAFFGSFVNDYSSISKTENTTKATLQVWTSGGREQAEIIKQLIDEDFTSKTGIQVKLQLVQISLTQAVLAQTAPDILLGTSRGQPVNLGVRGVLADLSKLEGFDHVKKQFTEKAMVPYSYGGKTYGIPITMSFHMMFIRTDVFKELGLTPPDTWDQFYTIISQIQRANMIIGLPYTTVSSQSSIDSGMGAKDMFPALLLQKGGKIYDDDNKLTVLDQKETVDAFEQWVELYTQYQLDTQFDFYNRFRTGEMPIGISDYGFYNTLEAATPEIKGMWEMRCIPGTLHKDGSIDRSEATSGSAAVILKDTVDLDASWKLVKWWSSADVQAKLGIEMELLMGKAARYTPANLEALKKLPWSKQELAVLQSQITHLDEIPEVIGGYYTVRGLDNAFRNVLFNGDNFRESLLEQMAIINTELKRKQKEFGINSGK